MNCVSKNLVLCLLHFTADSFTNMAQFNAVFSERQKLKDNAMPTILDPTIMSHHTSVGKVFILVSLVFILIYCLLIYCKWKSY